MSGSSGPFGGRSNVDANLWDTVRRQQAQSAKGKPWFAHQKWALPVKPWATTFLDLLGMLDSVTGVQSMARTATEALSINGIGPVAAPTPPVTGYIGWWDASDGTTTTAQLSDKSANGYNYTQTNAPEQPALSTINGRQALDFTGGASMSALAVAQAQPLTIIVVYSTTDSTSGRVFDSDQGGGRLLLNQDPTGAYGIYAGSGVQATNTPNSSPLIESGVFNNASSALYLDGAQVATGNPNPNTTGSTWYLARDGSGVRSNVVLGEMLIYPSALSDADRLAVELYLALKWSIPMPSIMFGWFKSDVGVTASGGLATAWADQSGNGNTVTDGGGGTGLEYGSTTWNGQTVIANTFAGNSNAQLQLTGLSPPAAFTVVLAGNVPNVGGGYAADYVTFAGCPDIAVLAASSRGIVSEDNLGASISSVAATSPGHSLVTVVRNGASSYVKVDGATASGALTNNALGDRIAVGKGCDYSAAFGATWDEFIILPAGLNAAALGTVEQYMSNKWALGTVSSVTGLTQQVTKTQTTSDPLGGLDASSQVGVFARNPADPLGGLDAELQAMVDVRSQSDAEGELDAMTAAQGWVQTQSDAEGMLDASSQAGVYARNPADPSGLTDAESQTDAATQSSSDALGGLDALTQAAAYNQSLSDPQGLLDALSQAAVYAQTVADALGELDASSQLDTAAQLMADALGLLDAATQAAIYAQTVADPEGLTDATTAAHGWAQIQSDPLGMLDAESQAGAFTQTPADNLGMLDAEAQAAAFARSSGDPSGLTDSESQTDTATQTPSDALGELDALSQASQFNQSQSDAEGMLDAESSVTSAVRSYSDALGLTDSMAQLAAYVQLIGDLQGLLDAMTQDYQPGGGASSQTVSDVEGLTDLISQVATYVQTLADALGELDTLAQAGLFSRNPADPVGGSDSTSQTDIATQTASDAEGLNDTAAQTFAAIRSLSEALGALDILAQASVDSQTASEAIGLLDAVQSVSASSRTQSDNDGLTDALSYERFVFSTVDDAEGLTDSKVVSLQLVQSFDDPLDLTDGTSITLTLSRSLADLLGLTDDVDFEHVYGMAIPSGPTSTAMVVRTPTGTRMLTFGRTTEGTWGLTATVRLGGKTDTSGANGPTRTRRL